MQELREFEEEAGEAGDLSDLAEGIARIDPDDAAHSEQNRREASHAWRGTVAPAQAEEQPGHQPAQQRAGHMAGKNRQQVRHLWAGVQVPKDAAQGRARQVQQRRQPRLGCIESAPAARRRI